MTETTRSSERVEIAPEAKWWLTLSQRVDVCMEPGCLEEFEVGDPCVWNSTLVEKLCEECASRRGIVPEISKRFRGEKPGPPKRPLSREEIRGVACSKCGALAGERCIGPKGNRRQRNHFERMQAAQQEQGHA